MYTEIRFEVPIEPVGKGRPRITAHGTYTPKKTKDAENAVRMCYRNRYGQQMFSAVPLKARITAVCRVPKSDSKKVQQKKIDGDIRPTKVPDADNIIKLVLDALNGYAYKDDSQIVEVQCEKWYAINPKIIVEISTLE